MLDEVELFVRGRRPKVVAFDDVPLLGNLPLFAYDGRAALLSKGRIGHHDIEPITRVAKTVI